MREHVAPALTAAAALAIVLTGDVESPVAGLVVLAALAYACGAYARTLPGAIATATLLASTLSASFVPVVICTLGPYLAGRVVRSRGRLVAELRARTRELEAEQEAYTRLAVRHERARIARELHDIVAHHLAVMVVQAGAGRMTGRDDPQRLAQIADAGRQALAEMERLVELIGEREHDVNRLLERARAAGLTIRAPELQLDGTAYRVVQEAVTNVLKHAPGADVDVRVGRGEIEIRDSGPATAPTLAATGAGLGLEGLRERLAAAGGSLDAGPHPDGGWSVRARLPI